MFKLIIYVCFVSITTDVTLGRIINLPDSRNGVSLHNILSTWEEAKVHCQKEGTILASPINDDVYDVIYNLIKETGSTFHIGTKASNNPGEFVSIEGIPLQNMTMSSWQEFDPWQGDCMAISFNGSIRIVDCETRLPYICFNPQFHWNLTNCGSKDQGYTYNEPTGNCYKMHDGKPWTDAQKQCENEGANLATIKNTVEAQSIIRLDGFSGHIRIAVGIKQTGSGDWKTFYGQPVEKLYNEWVYGYKPNNSAYQCGSIHRGGKLDDINCNADVRFICQKAPTL